MSAPPPSPHAPLPGRGAHTNPPNRFAPLILEPDPDCPACAQHRYEYLDGTRRAPVSLCGRNAVQIHEQLPSISLEELARKLERIAPVRVNEFALRFFPAPFEMTIFRDGRAIVKGTTDVGIARSLYAKYIGA